MADENDDRPVGFVNSDRMTLPIIVRNTRRHLILGMPASSEHDGKADKRSRDAERALAIAPPEGMSRVGSARRVRIEGTVSALPADWTSVKELSFDSSDASVITRRLIRPSVSTTGVKLREMPNFLKLIWVLQT